MPGFAPFRGLRYDTTRVALEDVIAPPYDVVTPEERAELVGRSPYNSIRIELPTAEDRDSGSAETDGSEPAQDPANEHGGPRRREDVAPDPYTAAARLFRQWIDSGILVRDLEPTLSVYRMSFTDDLGARQATTGVIGALEVDTTGKTILAHEQTIARDRGDRFKLLSSCRANLSPIWALSPAENLTDVCLGAIDSAAAYTEVTDTDSVRHELWRIADTAALTAIAQRVAEAPVVIADGHHRYETARSFFAEQGETATATKGGAALVMAFIVEIVPSELHVQAIHRVLRCSGGVSALMSQLSEEFELTPSPTDRPILQAMADHHSLCVVTGQGSFLGSARPSLLARQTVDLDAVRLDIALRTGPTCAITYDHDWRRASATVRSGGADAAVLLRPATIPQIAATARGGAPMPPKTTFFVPKPRTGLVFRTLSE